MATTVTLHFYEFLARLDKDAEVAPGEATPIGMHIRFTRRVTTDGVVTSETLLQPRAATYVDLVEALALTELDDLDAKVTAEKSSRR